MSWQSAAETSGRYRGLDGEAGFVVPTHSFNSFFPAVIVLNILYTSVQSAVSVIWIANWALCARRSDRAAQTAQSV
jgi:hypothetical protein